MKVIKKMNFKEGYFLNVTKITFFISLFMLMMIFGGNFFREDSVPLASSLEEESPEECRSADFWQPKRVCEKKGVGGDVCIDVSEKCDDLIETVCPESKCVKDYVHNTCKLEDSCIPAGGGEIEAIVDFEGNVIRYPGYTAYCTVTCSKRVAPGDK